MPRPFARRSAVLLCLLIGGCAIEVGDGRELDVVGDPMTATCGDATCNGTEDCETCPGDCGACAATCGDATCDTDETCQNCPSDCGPCTASCGDGACNGTETCITCAADCGPCAPECGDGTCDPDETCTSCAEDCGACPSVCGDGTCDPDETCYSCESDCGPCEVPVEWEETENEILILLNQFRAQNQTCGGRGYPATGAVEMNRELRSAARLHSQDMADQNYFGHDSLDGRSPWDRIRNAGYQGSGIGENIAAGNMGAQATFNQWVNSPGHCSNMMNPSATEVGIGYGYNQSAQYRHYWTQVFGR